MNRTRPLPYAALPSLSPARSTGTQDAHALGLLASQDGLDDGRLKQRQPQQFVDSRAVQAFRLGDLASTPDHPIVNQLLPLEGSRQRHQQWLLDLAGNFARSLNPETEPPLAK